MQLRGSTEKLSRLMEELCAARQAFGNNADQKNSQRMKKSSKFLDVLE